MKAVWEPVKLRVAFGEVPAPGDVLELTTGRRYEVHRVRGRSLHCIVVPAEHPVQGRLIPWCWSPRRRRARR